MDTSQTLEAVSPQSDLVQSSQSPPPPARPIVSPSLGATQSKPVSPIQATPPTLAAKKSQPTVSPMQVNPSTIPEQAVTDPQSKGASSTSKPMPTVSPIKVNPIGEASQRQKKTVSAANSRLVEGDRINNPDNSSKGNYVVTKHQNTGMEYTMHEKEGSPPYAVLPYKASEPKGDQSVEANQQMKAATLIDMVNKMVEAGETHLDINTSDPFAFEVIKQHVEKLQSQGNDISADYKFKGNEIQSDYKFEDDPSQEKQQQATKLMENFHKNSSSVNDSHADPIVNQTPEEVDNSSRISNP